MNVRPLLPAEGPATRLTGVLSRGEIPDLIHVAYTGRQVKVMVPEAEFSIGLWRNALGGLTLRMEAVFREHGEAHRAGGTWWDCWEVPVPPAEPSGGWSPEQTGRVLVGEITRARRRFRDLLAVARGED